MKVDYGRVIADLVAFYDFTGKTVLSVGAGGGKLIEYGRAAGRVLALDNDARALDMLRENLKAAGLEDKFAPVLGDFFRVDLKADVVLFEFCLHEMPDPAAAVERARRMAPAVVVFDHWPGSAWLRVTGEEEKVAASWAALARFPVKKKQSHEIVRFYEDYEELCGKVREMGVPSLEGIAAHKGKAAIEIPMSYGLALIESAGSPER